MRGIEEELTSFSPLSTCVISSFPVSITTDTLTVYLETIVKYWNLVARVNEGRLRRAFVFDRCFENYRRQQQQQE